MARGVLGVDCANGDVLIGDIFRVELGDRDGLMTGEDLVGEDGEVAAVTVFLSGVDLIGTAMDLTEVCTTDEFIDEATNGELDRCVVRSGVNGEPLGELLGGDEGGVFGDGLVLLSSIGDRLKCVGLAYC